MSRIFIHIIVFNAVICTKLTYYILPGSSTPEQDDINRLINLMTYYPLKFTIWKVITLDASLIASFIKICITYAIIIIQAKI